MSPIMWEIAPGDDRGILVIRLAPDHAAIVTARARALGLTPETFITRWLAELLEAERAERQAGFTCPRCGRTSHNPNDARERYCGACHVFVDDPPEAPGRG